MRLRNVFAVITALVLVSCGGGTAASGPVEAVTKDTFKSAVLQSASPVIVDFWAPWCGPCRMQAPIIEKLAVSDAFKGKVKFVKFNVDDDNTIPSSFGITGIPTLIIFKNGTAVETMVGLRTEEQLTAALNKVL